MAVHFPLYFPGKNSDAKDAVKVLAVDLRKTRSTFAIYQVENCNLKLECKNELKTDEFSSFTEMAKAYLSTCDLPFDRVSIAVPGPVILGKVETANLPWPLDLQEIRQELKAEKVCLVNDMEATAYSLGDLSNSEVITIHAPEEIMPGNVALLSPGNGLGEAGLFWDGATLRPFATEGGHTEFSPRNPFEVEFYQFLNKIYGIVSWENVLTKSGIYNIYRFLRDVGRHEEKPELSGTITQGDFIKNLAAAGNDEPSRLVRTTLEWFAEFLAREANYLALKLKSTGGLVITGDLAKELRRFINAEQFYKSFRISDKMDKLLKDIPLYFVFNDDAIAEGAALYGAYYE